MNNMIPKLKGIIEKLPKEEGQIVTVFRNDKNNEQQRVWSVQFKDQTILFEFVFDDSSKRESAFVSLLANAHLFGKIISDLEKKERDYTVILDALYTVSEQLLKLQKEYDDLVLSLKIDDEEYATVGEK